MQNRKLHLSLLSPFSPFLLPLRSLNIQQHSTSFQALQTPNSNTQLFLKFISNSDTCELKQNFLASLWHKAGLIDKQECNDCLSPKVFSFWRESSTVFHLNVSGTCNQRFLHSPDQPRSFSTAAPALPTQKHWHSH